MNIEALRSKLPKVIFDGLPYAINSGINTRLKMAHFLAQIHHESAGFNANRENLNYSAKGLLDKFKKNFTSELAKEYERKPVQIANRVYAGRFGNGPETSGDGWKFRGAGPIQLTFKGNFVEFAQSIGKEHEIMENPDLVGTKYPIESAVWFWNSRNINPIAEANDIVSVTKKVNGGDNGLDQRKKLFDFYLALIGE